LGSVAKFLDRLDWGSEAKLGVSVRRRGKVQDTAPHGL
jgi:hypothetical protein